MGKDSKKTVICLLCKKKFRRITNTHLWKYHRIAMEEYKDRFPNADIDAPQIKLRKEDCGHTWSKEDKEAQSRHMTKTKAQYEADTYRKRALAHYGLECFSCGKTSKNPKDFVVHHKDFLNFAYEFGNHDLENLEVYCKSCHTKLHNALSRSKGMFRGLSSIEKGFHFILKGLRDEFGLDLMDENFEGTPKRIARAYYEIFEGVRDTKKRIESILDSKFPAGKYNQMIISSNIEVYSMCPHHFLPVVYHIDVGYIPASKGFVLGISKLSRLVEILARRPIIQEALTQEIGVYLNAVKPLGVMVIVRGEHYCMKMRGVKQSNATMVTSYVSGAFLKDQKVRDEFTMLSSKSRGQGG